MMDPTLNIILMRGMICASLVGLVISPSIDFVTLHAVLLEHTK